MVPASDNWLIRMDPGGPFQFKAGQYATLGVDHGDKRIERAYSIMSSPYEEGLEFFIGTQRQARVHKT
jgi:ferredoxin-NADP reductase